jgi:hypothetical protein
MSKPKLISVDNNNYYLAKDIIEYDAPFFHGANTNIRDIIKKKNITKDNYIYSYIKNDKWIISKETYPRSKLLLSESWVNSNVPKFIVKNKKVIKNNYVNVNKIIEQKQDEVEVQEEKDEEENEDFNEE